MKQRGLPLPSFFPPKTNPGVSENTACVCAKLSLFLCIVSKSKKGFHTTADGGISADLATEQIFLGVGVRAEPLQTWWLECDCFLLVSILPLSVPTLPVGGWGGSRLGDGIPLQGLSLGFFVLCSQRNTGP